MQPAWLALRIYNPSSLLSFCAQGWNGLRVRSECFLSQPILPLLLQFLLTRVLLRLLLLQLPPLRLLLLRVSMLPLRFPPTQLLSLHKELPVPASVPCSVQPSLVSFSPAPAPDPALPSTAVDPLGTLRGAISAEFPSVRFHVLSLSVVVCKLVKISCQRVLQPQVNSGASTSPRVRVTRRHNC